MLLLGAMQEVLVGKEIVDVSHARVLHLRKGFQSALGCFSEFKHKKKTTQY